MTNTKTLSVAHVYKELAGLWLSDCDGDYEALVDLDIDDLQPVRIPGHESVNIHSLLGSLRLGLLLRHDGDLDSETEEIIDNDVKWFNALVKRSVTVLRTNPDRDPVTLTKDHEHFIIHRRTPTNEVLGYLALSSLLVIDVELDEDWKTTESLGLVMVSQLAGSLGVDTKVIVTGSDTVMMEHAFYSDTPKLMYYTGKNAVSQFYKSLNIEKEDRMDFTNVRNQITDLLVEVIGVRPSKENYLLDTYLIGDMDEEDAELSLDDEGHPVDYEFDHSDSVESEFFQSVEHHFGIKLPDHYQIDNTSIDDFTRTILELMED